MNITPQVPNLSVPTALNPHTQSLRRENHQREIITQPSAASQSAAEKGVASDKERGRTPAQNNANIDFARIKEQAELANSSIAGQGRNDEQNSEQNSEQNTKHNTEQKSEQKSEHSVEKDNQGEHEAQYSPVSKNASVQEKNEETKPTEQEQTTNREAIEQVRVISELQSRDKEVRSHEAAHAAVGGSVTGSPSFSYEKGPDGKRYAVEGEVAVDLSIVNGDPRATIEKMQKVHAAALAPVNPSTQDRQVANTATQLILEAQSKLLSELSNQQESEQNKTQAEDNSNKNESASVTRYLSKEANELDSSSDFEVLINKTLKNQDKIASNQTEVVVQRALRIENYYASISQAYEKSATSNFELTA